MKRFTSTDKWDDVWHYGLSPTHKCAWAFLNDRCDHAGVIEVPNVLMAGYVGDTSFTLEAFAEIAGPTRLVRLDSGKWWLPKYILFQDVNGISVTRNQHQPAIRSILKHHLPVPIGNDADGIYSTHNEWVKDGFPNGVKYPTNTPAIPIGYLSDRSQGKGTGKGKGKKRGPGRKKTEGANDSTAKWFEMFWSIVPNKVGRGDAEKAFAAAAATYDPEMIVRRTAVYLAAEQARYKATPEGFRGLHPATWLNGKRFLDEPGAVPVPMQSTLNAAWKACGRNGSGPPEWSVLAQNKALVQEMRDAHPPFDLLVEGIMECVQIVKGIPS
jgi:hypothetical protein